MASNSSNDTCHNSEQLDRAIANSIYAAFTILPYLGLILGIPSQIVSLVAFFIQSRKQKAYLYQLFCSLSDTVEIIVLVLLLFEAEWSDPNMGFDRYTSSYVLMWYSAHLAAPLYHVAVTNSLLASLSMSIDRVLAFGLPLKYRRFNHQRNQVLTVLVCITIATASSIFDCWRYYVQSEESGSYTTIFDVEYNSSKLANFFAHLRNVIRAFGAVLLIVCNGLMIYYYNQRYKVQQGASSGAGGSSEKEEKMKENRNLLLLTLSQSILIGLRIIGETLLHVVMFGVTDWVACGQLMLIMSTVGAIEVITCSLNFFIWLGVSKQFRQNVWNLFTKGPLCRNRIGATTVSEMSRNSRGPRATAGAAVHASKGMI